MKGMLPGPCLATASYRDQAPNFNTERVKGVENPDDCAGILAFDIWTHNWDRARNAGNLLIIADNKDKRHIVPVDFGNCFAPDNRPFSLDDLPRLAGEWMDIQKGMTGPVYAGIQHLLSKATFDKFIDRVEALDKITLEGLWEGAPDGWLSDEAKNAVITFLLARQPSVGAVIRNPKGAFPWW